MVRIQPKWSPRSWQSCAAQQLPQYPNPLELERVVAQLEQRPALVHPSEILKLKHLIGEAGQGRRFIVQAGECAERFIDCQSEVITDKMKILLQLSLLATHGLRKPVVSIGRIAGQFGKPRSDDVETRDSQALPSYRGDIINGFEFSPAARRPDPRARRGACRLPRGAVRHPARRLLRGHAARARTGAAGLRGGPRGVRDEGAPERRGDAAPP